MYIIFGDLRNKNTKTSILDDEDPLEVNLVLAGSLGTGSAFLVHQPSRDLGIGHVQPGRDNNHVRTGHHSREVKITQGSKS